LSSGADVFWTTEAEEAMLMDDEKSAVRDFWEQASCGEGLYLNAATVDGYRTQAAHRYRLEPCIEPFADFAGAKGKRVLEIGVGLGADHQRFAESGATLWGIDLTARAVEHVRRRFQLFGLHSDLAAGDAENLQFPDASFDLVYSWGVLHHSPDTPKAFAEVHRVLRPGGTAKIMIYQTWSLVGLMLWMRYAALRLRPWMTLAQTYSRYLESPGTKAYTVKEARQLCAAFASVDVSIVLTHGDLLESDAGQRHRGMSLTLARMIWPRTLLRRYGSRFGLFMLIEARK
jgi:ubiquinone/menaquinone biosynthesis C-methylase UbiE